MSIENFKDPRGEYKRICPYCLEPFIATHMNRFYCPEKNGIKNFCKHRQKRLVNVFKESGIELERPERPPLKVLFEPSDKDFRNIDEGIKETLLNRKIKILEKVLGELDSKDIAWDELEKLGFTLDNTDEFTLNDFGSQSPTYGKIQLIRHEGNIMKIKKLK